MTPARCTINALWSEAADRQTIETIMAIPTKQASLKLTQASKISTSHANASGEHNSLTNHLFSQWCQVPGLSAQWLRSPHERSFKDVMQPAHADQHH
jgi:hypothetical protein